MQKIETSMLKSMHPIISLTDKLLSLKSNPQTVRKEDVSSFLRFALDSLTLTEHSVYEVNLSRRELIRPDLIEQYKKIQYQFFLFGDDLPKAVKEISETKKVSQRMSYPKQVTNLKHGSNNFRRQGSSYSNRQQHFLYQGQCQRRRHTKQLRQSTQSSSRSIGKPGEPTISPINSMRGK